ncbi:MAG TPA: hypothetical protein O0X36_00830 [Methanocorpusculum sp.]|jgi:hypothetical protein|nr:hypothetical protein [Methanocorpusculum sp.]HJJ87341.1 hypothetical protein [Methanocorpusculum sp.]
MKTPQEYLDIIQEAHPCPVEYGFERAAWLYETREALRWALDFVELEFKHQIADIQDRGLTSEKYNVFAKVKNYTRVNLEELHIYNPEMFEDLVHIKATDAEKIIGRRSLYLEAKDILGAEEIKRYQTVNATELYKVVPQHVYDRLTEKEERLMDYVVEEVSA